MTIEFLLTTLTTLKKENDFEESNCSIEMNEEDHMVELLIVHCISFSRFRADKLACHCLFIHLIECYVIHLFLYKCKVSAQQKVNQ